MDSRAPERGAESPWDRTGGEIGPVTYAPPITSALNSPHIVVHTTVHTSGSATTILAALGVSLALVSLGWQAVSFWRSGSRVRVEIGAGATDGVRVISIPGSPTQSQADIMRSHGLTQPVLEVSVRNSGHAATSVMSVDLRFPNGSVMTGSYLPGSPELPSRIEGGSERTWLIDADLAVRTARAFEENTVTGRSWAVRGQAKVDGKKKPVVSKNDILVP
jgi:hypothetical protein